MKRMGTEVGIDERRVALRLVGRLLSDLGHSPLTDDDCLIAIEPLCACLGATRATMVLLPGPSRSAELARTAEFGAAEAALGTEAAASAGATRSSNSGTTDRGSLPAGPILALALSLGTTRIGSLFLERPCHAVAFDDEEVIFARGIANLIALRLSDRGMGNPDAAIPRSPAAALESGMRVATSVGHDLNNVLAGLLAAARRLGTDEHAEPRVAAAEIESLAHRALDLVRLQLDSVERAGKVVEAHVARDKGSA